MWFFFLPLLFDWLSQCFSILINSLLYIILSINKIKLMFHFLAANEQWNKFWIDDFWLYHFIRLIMLMLSSKSNHTVSKPTGSRKNRKNLRISRVFLSCLHLRRCRQQRMNACWFLSLFFLFFTICVIWLDHGAHMSLSADTHLMCTLLFSVIVCSWSQFSYINKTVFDSSFLFVVSSLKCAFSKIIYNICLSIVAIFWVKFKINPFAKWLCVCFGE